MTRVPSAVRGSVLAVALAACLAACSSGGSGTSGASGESPSAAASPTATVTADTSQMPSETPSESVPDVPVEPSVTPTATPTRSGSVSRVDDVTGRLSPLGKESVVVDASDGPHEVHLTGDTVVLDTQGSVCQKGAVPHRCTSAELFKALKAGVTFEARVLISEGDAIKIEEIVKE
ncbi:hypothetical protein ABZ470_28615 [Streptosporangium sp. NPDC020072]|uniref:hypothetical protein n=1 Tax=Streptosporangium sp. NPDC020072 TaxID=3154788 RepID=UPI003430793E